MEMLEHKQQMDKSKIRSSLCSGHPPIPSWPSPASVESGRGAKTHICLSMMRVLHDLQTAAQIWPFLYHHCSYPGSSYYHLFIGCHRQFYNPHACSLLLPQFLHIMATNTIFTQCWSAYVELVSGLSLHSEKTQMPCSNPSVLHELSPISLV